MFRRLIEERMRDRQVFVLERAAPKPEERDQLRSQILENVTASLRPHMEDLSGGEKQPPLLDPERTFGGLGTAAQLQSHVREKLRSNPGLPPAGGISPSRVFKGEIYISPPYHEEFQEGGGYALGAVNDGIMSIFGAPGFSFSGVPGISYAGIGVHFISQAPTPVLAEITPLGIYGYTWEAYEDLPSFFTRGGLGLYIGGEGVDVRNEAELWSQSGVMQFDAAQGEGNIAEAATPGHMPIGPAMVHMVPYRRYTFEIWLWQIMDQQPENGAFLATSWMHMPLLKVSIRQL